MRTPMNTSATNLNPEIPASTDMHWPDQRILGAAEATAIGRHRQWGSDAVGIGPQLWPGASASAAKIAALRQWFDRVPRVVITVGSFALVLVVGAIDYATGINLSVTAFYLLPVAVATWFASRRTGVFTACTGAVVWFIVDVMGRATIGHPFVPVWNAVMLGLEFVIVAVLLGAVRHQTEHLENTVAVRTEELQRAQMQLMETAKLETVGRLAAGIAHEVKNPLMTLSLGADYFFFRPAANLDERALVQDMKEAVRRASNIINLLLNISRPRPLERADEDINRLIENALTLVRHQLEPGHVAVVCQLQPALPRALLDRTRIEHALMNLFLNSLQAMPDGGTLTVRSYVSGGTEDCAPQLIVEVEDTGRGIGPADLNKPFEPFFTTKPPGQGTGLGLSIVREIVEIHGGVISLANRPEGGVRATLKFDLGSTGGS